LDSCLTIIPSREDAQLDGIEYEDYLRLFFEACDQPWEEIKVAQTKLIEKFNKAKEVKITNDDGTDLIMSIKDMTFFNSTTSANIPGSEIFSAPIKDSVNGKLVAKGKFKEGSYGVIEDIELEFRGGKVVDFNARVGKDILETILDLDKDNGEGSRFIGELGIGTNPHLTQHLINGLLVEKIAGSFHLALGNSLHCTLGDDARLANVNNGNVSHSNVHWDITTLLRGKNGKMILDGQVIQDNGLWVDENSNPDSELAVLNYGWDAIEESKRPSWWVEYKTRQQQAS